MSARGDPYRSSAGDLPFRDGPPGGGRRGEHWDAERFTRERDRVEVAGRRFGGGREFDEESSSIDRFEERSVGGRGPFRPRPAERGGPGRGRQYYVDSRSGDSSDSSISPSRSAISARSARGPLRSRRQSIALERDYSGPPPQRGPARPGYLRRQSSLDTFDRRPPRRFEEREEISLHGEFQSQPPRQEYRPPPREVFRPPPREEIHYREDFRPPPVREEEIRVREDFRGGREDVSIRDDIRRPPPRGEEIRFREDFRRPREREEIDVRRDYRRGVSGELDIRHNHPGGGGEDIHIRGDVRGSPREDRRVREDIRSPSREKEITIRESFRPPPPREFRPPPPREEIRIRDDFRPPPPPSVAPFPPRRRSPPRFEERGDLEIRIAEPDRYGDEGFREFRREGSIHGSVHGSIHGRARSNSHFGARASHDSVTTDDREGGRTFPRRGKTKMPRKILDIHAVLHKGYPFEEDVSTLEIRIPLQRYLTSS